VAYVPTVVVGRYAPFGIAGVYHATICMPWAFIVALWHVEDPTTGGYIATTGVATFAPPALPRQPRDCLRKTRRQAVRYSFPVSLLHPRLHTGLSRRSA